MAAEHALKTSESVEFCTLGMFIIDDIYPSPTSANQTPNLNIIGGASTYAVIGARLFSPPPTSQSVGWIVDAGSDFPPELRSTITSWDTGVVMRARDDGLTTRGWNGYSGNEHRAFKYLTPKKRLTYEDLDRDLLASKSFHLICGAERCMDQVQGIVRRRQEAALALGTENTRLAAVRPLIVWEPTPDLCTAEALAGIFEALRFVDVVSPNHDELGSLYGFSHGAGIDVAAVESHAHKFLEYGIGEHGEGAVVVRCGAKGCFVLTRTIRRWLPAYHADAGKVVDPTGGGNGFLGGLTIGLIRTGSQVIEAACWGNVAASFCIEQVGVPVLSPGNGSSQETWNGVIVEDRLSEYREQANV